MAQLKVRGEKSAKDIADGLVYSDLKETIEQERLGNRHGGTRISRNFLQSVKACTSALPHTNEAAKSARSTSESMQHYLGSGSVFLTVTFDDENSLLMQVLSGQEIDNDDDLTTLEDVEFRKRWRERRQIRLQYPGVAALHFEMLLNILVEEVVGWSMREHQSTGKPGIFGMCQAFCLAVEEQGRKTLHAHMTIWIKRYKKLQEAVFFAQGRPKTWAERSLKAFYDHFAMTALTADVHHQTLRMAWDHQCEHKNVSTRELPMIVNDQQLRTLRNRKGYDATDGTIATCPHCAHEYTYEQLVCGLLANTDCPGYGQQDIVPDDCNRFEIPTHRCFAQVVQYQRMQKKNA